MTQNNRKIGLTGGIASGKSTVTEYLLSLGYPVIDGDNVAREVAKDPEILERIKERFGKAVLLSDGTLNREAMGRLVFGNAREREALNAIMHPEIYRRILESGKDHGGILFFDIPLLMEVKDELSAAGLTFDEIWLVYVEEKIRLGRLEERDGISADYAREKIASQMSLEEKRKLADVILDNSGTVDQLKEQVRWELKRLEN